MPGLGEERWELSVCLTKTVSFSLEDKRVLEMDSSDDYTMWMYIGQPEVPTEKWLTWQSWCVYFITIRNIHLFLIWLSEEDTVIVIESWVKKLSPKASLSDSCISMHIAQQNHAPRLLYRQAGFQLAPKTMRDHKQNNQRVSLMPTNAPSERSVSVKLRQARDWKSIYN